jgi:apolipoprotein N-acyltransferase
VTLLRGLALPRRDWVLLFAGTVLAVLAYPPFHLLVPSFVCLVPAVWLLDVGAGDARPIRRHLVQGFWFGLLTQGAVLYWMVVALWHFTPMSFLGYAATILILAVYTAVLFGVTGEVLRRTGLPLVAVFPVFWTALEWWVGHQGDIAFPWLGLGTSLTGYPTLVQIAEVVGARGVTFLLVVANMVIGTTWLVRHRPRAVLRLVAVGIGVLGALAYGTWRERTVAVRTVGSVALVQPNVGFEDKWEEGGAPAIFADLMRLSQEALATGKPEIVFWPEAAVPVWFPYTDPTYEREIGALARKSGVPFFVGGVHLQRSGPDPQDYDYWNAGFAYDTTGSRDPYPVYHKRYLVPITERVPFVNPRWFKLRWFGAFAVGEPGAVYDLGPGRFGVIICYESAFEDLPRRYRALGADYIANVTNDAWFGETAAPRQHLAHLVMRAIENRVGIARAANTGISGFVDPFGRIYDQTRLGEQRFVVGEVRTTDVLTLYTRMGDWVGLLSLVGTGALLAALFLRRR